MKKKVLTLLFMALFPMAMMAYDAVVDGIYYDVASGYATVTHGDNPYTGEVDIPEKILTGGVEYTVTSIGEYAFQNCTGLTSVTIPSSVTSIGNSAFEGCTDLTSVKVTVNDLAAFCDNQVVGQINSQIGKPVTLIDSESNEIKDYIIPEGVTSIGDNAFSGCTGLTSVTIPSSVTSIGHDAYIGASGSTYITCNAFSGCDNLVCFKVRVTDNADFCKGQIVGIIFSMGKPITLIDGYGNEITEFDIPDGVTSIGDNAFSCCTGLTSVTIPSSVTSIGYYRSPFGQKSYNAFSGCDNLAIFKVRVTDNAEFCNNQIVGIISSMGKPFTLVDGNGNEITEYNIPEGVTSIGERAFQNCTGITSVSIPQTVTSIGEGAFFGCNGLTSVIIPQSPSFAFTSFSGCDNLVCFKVRITDNAEFCNNQVVGQINSQIGKPVTLIDSEGNEIKDYIIPDGVTSIGDNAFSCCTGLTSVTIPSSVTSIGVVAFYGCSGLTSVSIPEGVTSIGEGAFSGCTGLTSVTIPSSVTSIGSGAFNNTGLYENAPDGVFYVDNWVCGYKGKEPEGVLSLNPETHGIADGVFYKCYKLRGVTIPEGVKRIGARAFSCCDNITSITIPSSVKSIGSEAFFDCHLTEVLSYIEDPFDIDDSVFRQYGGPKYSDIFFTSATLYVPAGTKEKYLATPAWNQFQNIVEIKNIQFADATVKAICVENWDTNGDGELSYEEAAAVIDLGEVFINNSEITKFDELQYFTGLTSIGERAFYGCTNLTSVAIPSSVTSVGNYAFQDCSGLTKVIVTDIAAWCGISFGFFEEVSNPLYYAHHLYCDENTEITNLVIPQSVSSINKYAFYGCSGLTSVEIPSSVLSIGNQAFFCCSGLTSMTVDKGNGVYDSRNDCNAIIETASNELILGCQNTVIPSSVTSIGDNAFSCCIGLTSVTIPSSVTGIGERAFQNCTDLTSVIIPQRVTSIAYNAFDGCENASFKVCVTDKAAFCNNQIVGILSGMGKTFALIDGDGIEITEFNIPEGVKSIGEMAFTWCTGLTSVTIPKGVTSIGNYAFHDCTSLTSVEIPTSVTSIGEGAFRGCTGLMSVTLTEGVTLDDHVFKDCESLMTWKVRVTDKTAFCNNQIIGIISDYSDCTVKLLDGDDNEITAFEIPKGVTDIGNKAFYGCSDLTSVTIPDSLTGIGLSAFEGCASLKSVTIPASVTSIGAKAFYNCASMTSVYSYLETPLSVSANTFSNYAYATLYVPVGKKEEYEAASTWRNFSVIKEMSIEPINQDKPVDIANEIDKNTNLNGNLVGDVYFSINEENGEYNATEGCIVINTPTLDNTMNELVGSDIFGEDFNNQFTGVVFMVPAGKGSIKVEAETTGGMVLKVKIGNNDPATMQLTGKLIASFPYNVTEETYVYIYGGSTAAAANVTRRAASDGELKIYSIEVESVPDGISTVQIDDNDDAPVYNLNGQRVNTPTRGIFIKNGKKVLVK